MIDFDGPYKDQVHKALKYVISLFVITFRHSVGYLCLRGGAWLKWSHLFNVKWRLLMVKSLDIQSVISRSWVLYKENFWLLVGASLVCTLVIMFSVGILAGPMTAGLFIVISKIMKKDESVGIGNLFDGFSFFLPTFLIFLIWGVVSILINVALSFIPFVGQIAAMIFGYAFSAFVFIAVVKIVTKNQTFAESSRSAFELLKANFWPLIGLYFIGAVVSAIGALALVVGVFFTIPLGYVIYIIAAKDVAESDDNLAIEPPDFN